MKRLYFMTLMMIPVSVGIFNSGCSNKDAELDSHPIVVAQTVICPPFPSPELDVLTKIQGLHDPKIDSWMIELFRLKRELEVCK